MSYFARGRNVNGRVHYDLLTWNSRPGRKSKGCIWSLLGPFPLMLTKVENTLTSHLGRHMCKPNNSPDNVDLQRGSHSSQWWTRQSWLWGFSRGSLCWIRICKAETGHKVDNFYNSPRQTMTILNNETTQEIPNRKKGAGQRRGREENQLRRSRCRAELGLLSSTSALFNTRPFQADRVPSCPY